VRVRIEGERTKKKKRKKKRNIGKGSKHWGLRRKRKEVK
jgi:hypothetical protein